MLATMNKGRVGFRYENTHGAVIELSVLEDGQAGIFHQVCEENWEHVTDHVLDRDSCKYGIKVDTPQEFAILMNTVHVSLVTGYLSELKPWQSSSPAA